MLSPDYHFKVLFLALLILSEKCSFLSTLWANGVDGSTNHKKIGWIADDDFCPIARCTADKSPPSSNWLNPSTPL
jgi:hypothetical protein